MFHYDPNNFVHGQIQKQSPGVFSKKVFLEISQHSQENTCARVSFLIKLGLSLQLY